MDRTLHELILEADRVAEETDRTHVEVAEAIGMNPKTHRRWRNRELREGGGVSGARKRRREDTLFDRMVAVGPRCRRLGTGV